MSVDLTGHALARQVPVALYYQVREDLLHKIQSGQWGPDFKMPPERELCETYGVSRITVRKALDDLQNEGYLDRVQGKGTFVRRATMEKKLSKFYSFGDELRLSLIHICHCEGAARGGLQGLHQRHQRRAAGGSKAGALPLR